MLDPRLLRDDLAATVKQLARRGVAFDGEAFALLEKQRKTLQIATESLQKQRNENAKNIGKAKSSGEDIQPLLDKVQGDGNKLQQLQDELNAIAQQLSEMLATIPNILATEVPDGFDESCNKEIAKWGALPQHDFAAKDHVDLGAKLGLDFATAAKIASARFAVLKGDLATMHRALIQFMLDQHTACGYCEVYVPFLANAASLYGTGQLPKFADDLFQIAGNSDLYLIPTAEVPVTNIVRDTITPAADLPLKFVCHTPCFRSEAGAYGRDVRGMIRQHQFEKVELVQIVSPANSQAALACLTDDAINILQKLQLPYRKMLLCAGDTGFSATKTYDLEVWLPGQKAYREISSCSNFGDFQARRMGARWRDPAANKPQLLHTINGSGLAVGRTLIAIMENYQDEHGNIAVPKALQPYMAGTTVLTANNQ